MSWSRSLLVLAAVIAVLVAAASPVLAQRSRRTTTTIPEAPGQGAVPEGAVVNSWALTPASPDPQQPVDRPNFSYAAAAGEVINDAVTLYNYSNVQLTFTLYATDAFNNTDGQFDLLPEDEKPTDVGAWVKLPQASLTLAARTQASFPFSITVPANARPGDHAGAILASNDATGVGPSGQMVNVDRRTGSRIYLRVAGPVAPELTIRKIESSYHHRLNPFSGKVDVTFRIENTGNVRLSGRHSVSSSGVLGLGSKKGKTRTLNELLPGQSVEFKQSFEGIPATLIATATAEVTPSAVGEGSRQMAPVTRRSLMLAVPLALLAVALVVVLVRRSRRSYRRHAAEQAERTPELQLQ